MHEFISQLYDLTLKRVPLCLLGKHDNLSFKPLICKQISIFGVNIVHLNTMNQYYEFKSEKDAPLFISYKTMVFFKSASNQQLFYLAEHSTRDSHCSHLITASLFPLMIYYYYTPCDWNLQRA